MESAQEAARSARPVPGIGVSILVVMESAQEGMNTTTTSCGDLVSILVVMESAQEADQIAQLRDQLREFQSLL
mgnify:CR=1 FL=1